jgi:prevent-host-death family protein
MVMRHAKIAELKARLSEYLGTVRRGGTVIVYDRSTPIARLVPYEDGDVDDLVIEEPSLPPSELKKLRPVRLRRPVDVVRLLRESRDHR